MDGSPLSQQGRLIRTSRVLFARTENAEVEGRMKPYLNPSALSLLVMITCTCDTQLTLRHMLK